MWLSPNLPRCFAYISIIFRYRTDCDLPCTTSTYSMSFSYREKQKWMEDVDNGAEWVVVLYFNNYRFT